MPMLCRYRGKQVCINIISQKLFNFSFQNNVISIFRLQARMATKKAKPNGQFHLLPEKVEEYFSDILISDLPGVGYSTTQKLNNLTLKTCADLQQVPMVKLQHDFGKKLGETLYQYCRGIDNKPLAYDQVSLQLYQSLY